jgi:F-type H+-transporting ATPase subunit alpha
MARREIPYQLQHAAEQARRLRACPASALLRAPSLQWTARRHASSSSHGVGGAPPRPPALALGVVAHVTGDSVIVQSLRSASSFALVTFQGGAAGLVTDLTSRGTHVAMVSGRAPGLNETAVVEEGPMTLRVSPAVLGRVLSPLGEPLDGAGQVDHAPWARSARTQAVVAASPPSILARGPFSAALPSGFKAVDAFYPILRGTSSVVTGERGAGKRTFVEGVLSQVARSNDAAAAAGEDAQPVVCVYVAVGQSVGGIRDLLRRLQACGALRHTVVVAAPSGSGAGSTYLAPFAGAALGEYFRDSGRHALVVYDDLNSHFEAARRVSRVDWARTGAAPTCHAALFERCAQLSSAQGGGSLTGIALLADVPSGAAYLALEHIKSRELVANTASFADNVIALKPSAVRAGALLSVPFEELAGRSGHAATGAAMRHYVNRMREVLSEVAARARGAAIAARVGVAPEVEADGVLDLHAKIRLLLVPTMGMLGAIVEARARGAMAADEVASLGLQDLAYTKAGHGGVADSAAVAAVEERSMGGPMRRSSTVGQRGVRFFSSSPSRPPAKHIGDRVEELKAKMDGEQLRTLMAVQGARLRKRGRAAPGAMSAAEAYFARGGAAAAAVEKEGRKAEEVEYDSIFDVPDEPSGLPPAPEPVPAPSPESAKTGTQPAWWGAMSGKPPSRGFSTAAKTALSFAAPTGRTPPAQLFAGIAPEPASEAGQKAAEEWQWRAGPHTGDPARTLLTLFIGSHGYVSRVPLPFLLSYERGLYDLFAALPAPAGTPPPPSTWTGIRHVASSSARAGYTTLLDALLSAPVPLEMASAPRPDIGAAIQAHALAIVARAAATAASAQAQQTRAEELRRYEEEKTAAAARPKRSWLAILVSAPSRAPPAAQPPAPPPPPAAAAEEHGLLDGLAPYLRSEAPLSTLPPVWAAAHIAAAEYTRTFLSEDLLPPPS